MISALQFRSKEQEERYDRVHSKLTWFEAEVPEEVEKKVSKVTEKLIAKYYKEHPEEDPTNEINSW